MSKPTLLTALGALEKNHQFHQDHDDHDGYAESEMEAINNHALAIVAQELANPTPIPMVLFCPNCNIQHIDEPETELTGHAHHDGAALPWDNPPHRSHLCAGCGYIWRPADVPTTGVREIETHGKHDNLPTMRIHEIYIDAAMACEAFFSISPSAGVVVSSSDYPTWKRFQNLIAVLALKLKE